MTIPELRQLAEDLLKKPRGPWGNYGNVFLGVDYDSIEEAEAEARRLNAMPGLLRAAVNDLYMSGELSEIMHSIALGYVARCEAHQKGEA